MYYKKREFARLLRGEQTDAEKKVWKLLRDRKCLGLKFRRQHVVEGFIADFYCHEYKLAIELDGKVHQKQKDYDKARDSIIESEGVMVIRIKNSEIERNPNIILRKINKFLKQ